MKKILLIDDEQEILSLLQYLFNLLNYEIFTFPDVIPLKSIAEISPDVIILDYRLGEKSGSDFCKAIKADPEIAHIPVILLSGDNGLPQIAQDSYANAYVGKPFDVEQLNKAVKGVMLPGVS